jgi:hypothetical protein
MGKHITHRKLGMVLLPLLMLVPMARYPNAIEKTVVLKGGAAASVAGLFGLSSSGSVSLPLSRSDGWAVYMLKQDTPERLLNDNNNQAPARYNVLEFSPSPTPSLRISPYWLDLETGAHSKPKPGYSFSSPLVPEKPDATNPWSVFLQRLKKEIPQAEWSKMQKGEQLSIQRCFGFEENWELCIDVSKAPREEGHGIGLTVRPYFPEREQRFQEWKKPNGHLD